MTPTHFSVALAMVAVTVILFLWFQRSLAAGSARRMTRMLTRVGLDLEIATRGDPRTEAVVKEARRRCANCRVEDFCNRWLTGKYAGDDSFCPNARVFRSLANTGLANTGLANTGLANTGGRSG